MIGYGPTLGVEELELKVHRVLFEEVNDEYAVVNAARAAQDLAYFTLIGAPYVATVAEPVPTHEIHPAHQPELIEAPPHRLPNLSIMIREVAPGPVTGEYDQATISYHSHTLAIELMVKSDVSATDCSWKLTRLADACVNVILRDPELQARFRQSPRLILTDVMIHPEKNAYGKEWWWRAGRLDFTIVRINDHSE